MALRLVLDQNTERRLASTLREAGHDVERVVAVPDLGEGATDAEIACYAVEHDRTIVTYDSDFTALPPASHDGVFFIPDQHLLSHEVATIVQAVTEQHASPEEMTPVVFLTKDWL